LSGDVEKITGRNWNQTLKIRKKSNPSAVFSGGCMAQIFLNQLIQANEDVVRSHSSETGKYCRLPVSRSGWANSMGVQKGTLSTYIGHKQVFGIELSYE
jgi:hypothetical protein